MDWLYVVVAAVAGFVLGSVPVGLWVCAAYGVDIRQVGSGRIGGTNAHAACLKAAIPPSSVRRAQERRRRVLVRLLIDQLAPGMDTTLRALAASLAGEAAV
ncbi:MAG: glycerol-3-phosphate acyltransferase [Caldilineaceae bacterium]